MFSPLSSFAPVSSSLFLFSLSLLLLLSSVIGQIQDLNFRPVIYSLDPPLVSTDGGVLLTMLGRNLLSPAYPADGTLPPLVTFNPGTFTNTSVRAVCVSEYNCTISLPPGQGLATVSATVAGVTSYPLPRWPQDVFFTSTPTRGYLSSLCTFLYNPSRTASGWASTPESSNDWLCSSTLAASVNFTFIYNDSPTNYRFDLPNRCIQINVAGSSDWPNSWLCYPASQPYQFIWWSNTPATAGITPQGYSCLWIQKLSDSFFRDKLQYLCAISNTPYNGQSQPFYQYASPNVTFVSQLNGTTAGGEILTINGTSLGFNPPGTVTIGGRPCALQSFIPHVQINCVLPRGEGITNPVIVNVGGQTNWNPPNFRYNPPTLFNWTLVSGNGGTAGGSIISISGINFGITPGVVTFSPTINNLPCPIVPGNFTDTGLNCTLPAGVGFNLQLRLSAIGPQLSNSISFGYSIPTLTNFTFNRVGTTVMTPVNCATVGCSITIVGFSFGPSSQYGAVRLTWPTARPSPFTVAPPSVANCPAVSWSHSQIVCNMPGGVGSNVTLSVTITFNSASRVNDYSAFSMVRYQPPFISGIFPAQAFPGTLLIVSGSNFGSGTFGRITIGGLVCSTAAGTGASWSQGRIECVVPNSNGTYLNITVQTWDQFSNGFFFQYVPTFLMDPRASLAQGRPTMGGAVYNLTRCLSFGRQSDTVLTGPGPITILDYNPPAYVTFTFPRGTGFTRHIGVRVNNIPPPPNQVADWGFSYSAPVLFNLSSTSGYSEGGYSITLYGWNFGSSTNQNSFQLFLGGVQVTVQSVTDGAQYANTLAQAVFIVPKGSGLNNPVVLTVSNIQAGQTLFFNYLAPTLDSMSPLNGPSSGGTNLTLIGTGFTVTAAVPRILVAFGKVFLSAIPLNATMMIVTTPPGNNAINVIVQRGTQSSAALTFTYDSPQIRSISPATGETQGGSIITIQGINFGGLGPAATVFVDGIICPPANIGGRIFDNFQYPCYLPASQGDVLVQLISDTGTSNDFPFSYSPPVVNSISPANGPTSGFAPDGSSVFITIRGRSLGVKNVFAYIGGRLCNARADGAFFNATLIRCALPAGEGANLPTEVVVSNRSSLSTNPSPPLFTYDPPQVQQFTPLGVGPTAGGSILTVRGENFGFNGSVSVGGTPCFPTLTQAHNEITCILPLGQGINNSIVVFAAGLQSPPFRRFTYERPMLFFGSLTLFGRANGPTVGGVSLFLNGSNFGADGFNFLTVGPYTVRSSTLMSANRSLLSFVLPPGVGRSHEVKLTVANQTYLGNAPLFSYDPPEIWSISGCQGDQFPRALDCPINGNLTNGDQVYLTISGKNFGAEPDQVSVIIYNTANFNRPDEIYSYSQTDFVMFNDSTIVIPLRRNEYGGFGLPVEVTVAGQTVTQPYLSYFGPSFIPGTLRFFNGSLSLDAALSLMSGSSLEVPITLNDEYPVPNRILIGARFLGNDSSVIDVRFGLSSQQIGGISGSRAVFNQKTFKCSNVAVLSSLNGNSLLACDLEQGAGTNLTLQLRVGKQLTTDSSDRLSYPAPLILPNSIRITAVDNSRQFYASGLGGQSTQGDVVYFDVANVGPLNWRSDNLFYQPALNSFVLVSVFYDNGDVRSRCLNPVYFRHPNLPNTVQVVCKIQAGSGRGYRFQLLPFDRSEMAGPFSADRYNFIEPPRIYRIEAPNNECTNRADNSTVNCPTEGGYKINIYYANPTQGQIVVRVGSNYCLSPVNATINGESIVSCNVPPGAGQPSTVVLIIGSLYSAPSSLFSYAGPTINQVTGCSPQTDPLGAPGTIDCPRVGGTTITLTGTNFGPATASVVVAGRLCQNVTHVGLPQHRVVTCVLQAGTYTDQPVLLIQLGGVPNSVISQRVSYFQCRPGFYSLPDELPCLQVPNGTYTDTPGLSLPKPCLSGTFADQPGLSQCRQCAIGRFSKFTGGAIGPVDCSPCPSGQYVTTQGAQNCLDCPPGQFNNGTDPTRCYPCPAGSAAGSSGSTSCSACDPGSFTASPGQASCIACGRGSFQPNNGSIGCISCGPGSFSDLGASVCSLCTAGSFNNATAQSTCLQCPVGRFVNETGSRGCLDCSPGSSTNAQTGQLSCTPCAAGFSAAFSGLSTCSPCPLGFFANVTGLVNCFACQPGFDARAPAATQCDACPPGQYASLSGTQVCALCPAGRSALGSGSVQCDKCLAGTFQPGIGQSYCYECPSGQFNNVPEQVECVDCAPGSYTNSSSQTICRVCSAGKISVKAADVNQVTILNPFFGNPLFPASTPDFIFRDVRGPTVCSVCTAGTYADADGLSVCLDCDYGSFSDSDGLTGCSLCAPGEYQSELGRSFCSPCATGDFSAFPGSKTCATCPGGRFAPVASRATSCSLCDPGQFSTTSMQDRTSCQNCTSGTYSSVAGADQCTPCNYGTFSADDGASFCTQCVAGRFNSPLTTGTFNQFGPISCIPANPGYYVPAFGSSSELACNPGTYSAAPGATSCAPCDLGQFSDQAAVTACTLCDRGRFTDAIGSLTCRACEPGFISNTFGSAQCSPCEAGTVQPDPGMSSCVNCDAGFAQPAQGKATCFKCLNGFYADAPKKKSCEACLVGTFSPYDGTLVSNQSGLLVYTGVSQCSLCPVRQFQDAQGQAECKFCPLGRANSGSGKPLCDACPVGQFQNQTGQLNCTLCYPGTFASNLATIDCDVCPSGTFMDGFGAADCVPCAPGNYQRQVRSTACVQCDIGRFTSSNRSVECTDCPAGSAQNSRGATICPPCQPGFAQPQTGQADCLACPTGFEAPSNGTVNCAPCKRGKFAPANATAVCLECPAGFAQPEDAQGSCFECPAGTYAPLPGSTVCQSCGVVSPNHYQPLSGQAFCRLCDQFSSANALFTQCLCDIGYALYFQNRNPANATCRRCPRGAVCSTKGTLWDEMGTEVGYWEAGNKVYYPCILVQSCPGGNPENKTLESLFPGQDPPEIIRNIDLDPRRLVNVTDYRFALSASSPCGSNKEGPLCSLCSVGHVEGLGGVCFPCAAASGGSWAAFVIIGLIILAVLVFAYWWLLRSDRSTILLAAQEARLRQREDVGFVEDFDMDYEMKKNRFKEVLTHMGAPEAKPNYLFKLKIVISFAQIVTNLAIDLQVSWPHNFKAAVAYLTPFNFDFIQVSTVGCVVDTSYYNKLLLVILVPFFLILGLTLFYYVPQIAKYTSKQSEHVIARKMVKKNYAKLVLFTLFLVYPNVSSTILRLYNCQTINGFSYLRADFRLNCYTSTWNRWSIVVPFFIIIYPIGVPLYFFWNVWRFRLKLDEIGVRAELGFLYDCYSRPIWFFELLDMAHKILLTSVVSFFSLNAQMPVAMSIVGIYTIIILCTRPYIRDSDDLLHILAQTEILILVLAGNVFNNIGDDDELMDIVLTVILIGAIILFTVFFLYQAADALYLRFKHHIASKKVKEEKLAGLGSSKEEMEERRGVLAEQEMRHRENVAKDDYSDVLPEINRRDLRPISRPGISGEYDLSKLTDLKRNPLWGTEGNNALYDPVNDDMIGEVVPNPLNSAASESYATTAAGEQPRFAFKKKKDVIADRERQIKRDAMAHAIEMANKKAETVSFADLTTINEGGAAAPSGPRPFEEEQPGFASLDDIPLDIHDGADELVAQPRAQTTSMANIQDDKLQALESEVRALSLSGDASAATGQSSEKVVGAEREDFGIANPLAMMKRQQRKQFEEEEGLESDSDDDEATKKRKRDKKQATLKKSQAAAFVAPGADPFKPPPAEPAQTDAEGKSDSE